MCHAGGEIGEYIINGDAHTSDAGLTAAFACLEGDEGVSRHEDRVGHLMSDGLGLG